MGNIVFVIYRPARQVLAAGMRTVVTGGGGTGAVDSVNGQTGVVVLTATDVGADTAGTAAAAVGTHVAASDPHPQYLTPAEGNAAYDALGAAASAVSTHVAASDPHPQYNTQAEGDARYERNLTAGANITIDRTNPAAPVISASGGGGAGGAVDSVNGQTGVVVLDTDDIAEGVSNLYFTNGRAAAAAPVQTVDGQTGAVSLSSSYAPMSHVGAGGAAHANVVAAGAAGFMTGADKSKLDGIEAGAEVNVPTDLSLGTITTTTIPLNSSTGTDVTLPAATTSLAGLQSAADKTKIDGVATGATANSSDATLLARANHTGTQTALTISDFASSSRAQTEAELIAGTNITITPAGSGATRTLTIAASGGGGVSLPVVQSLSSTRNLVLADINTFNVNSTGTNYTVTIQPQSAETWTADAEIHFLPTSTGNIVITGGTGVSLNGVVAGSITLSTQNGAASIKRIASDSWWVGGTLGTLAEQRAALGLVKQTNSTDTTPGSLLTVGAFGIGGTASAVSADSMAITGVAGIYDADGAASLPAGVSSAALIRAPKGETADHRLLIARGAGPVVSAWISSASFGSNTPWDKVFTSYGVNAVVIDTGSIGYGTGSGGTVTQATDKTTGVTLNKPSGKITTAASALGAGVSANFLVTNSRVSTSDCILVSIDATTTSGANYRVEAQHVAVGTFRIRITNISAGSLSEALAINFSVIKGASA